MVERTPLTRPVLLYDAECRVCRFVARAVSRADRGETLGLLPLQAVEAVRLLDGLPEDERLASWRLARPDGSLVGRGTGVPVLLESLRLTRPLGRLLQLVPGRTLDAAYELAARNRGRLGRVVPRGAAPRRFP